MFSVKLMKAILAITKNTLNQGKQALECIEIKDGIATVTDGHRLYQLPAKDEVDGLYRHGDVETAMKVAAAQKTDVRVCSVAPQIEEWQYPRCDHLVPSTHGKTRVTLGAKYLRDLCDLVIAGHEKGMVDFYIPENNPISGQVESAIVVHFLTSEEDVARGLIMPIQRRDGMCFEYKGRQSEPLLPTGTPAPKKQVAA